VRGFVRLLVVMFRCVKMELSDLEIEIVAGKNVS
jgi:hypothetical protein